MEAIVSEVRESLGAYLSACPTPEAHIHTQRRGSSKLRGPGLALALALALNSTFVANWGRHLTIAGRKLAARGAASDDDDGKSTEVPGRRSAEA